MIFLLQNTHINELFMKQKRKLVIFISEMDKKGPEFQNFAYLELIVTRASDSIPINILLQIWCSS